MKKDKLFDFPKYDLIKERISNEITAGKHYHFFSRGEFSFHEIFLYILSFTGAARIINTSYSLSDITIRTFSLAIQELYIKSMDLLLSKDIKRNKIEMLLFADNLVNKVYLSKLHMKITLFEGKNFTAVLNTSANSTLNPTSESGVICTIPEIIENIYKPELKLELKKASLWTT